MTDYQWNPVGEFAAQLEQVIKKDHAFFDKYVENHPDNWGIAVTTIGATGATIGEGQLEGFQVGAGINQAMHDGDWVSGTVSDAFRAVGLIPFLGGATKAAEPVVASTLRAELQQTAPIVEQAAARAQQVLTAEMPLYVKALSDEAATLKVPVTLADGTTAMRQLESECVPFSTALVAKSLGLEPEASLADVIACLAKEHVASITTLGGMPLEPAIELLQSIGAEATKLPAGTVSSLEDLTEQLRLAGPNVVGMVGVDLQTIFPNSVENLLKADLLPVVSQLSVEGQAAIESASVEIGDALRAPTTWPEILPEIEGIAARYATAFPELADGLDAAMQNLRNVTTGHLLTFGLDEGGELVVAERNFTGAWSDLLAQKWGLYDNLTFSSAVMLKNASLLGEEAIANAANAVDTIAASDLSLAVKAALLQLAPMVAAVGVAVTPLLRGDLDSTLLDLKQMADPETDTSVLDWMLAHGALPPAPPADTAGDADPPSQGTSDHETPAEPSGSTGTSQSDHLTGASSPLVGPRLLKGSASYDERSDHNQGSGDDSGSEQSGIAADDGEPAAASSSGAEQPTVLDTEPAVPVASPSDSGPVAAAPMVSQVADSEGATLPEPPTTPHDPIDLPDTEPAPLSSSDPEPTPSDPVTAEPTADDPTADSAASPPPDAPGDDASPETPVPSDERQVSTAAWGAVLLPGSSSITDSGQIADPALTSPAAASVDPVSVVTPGLTDWLVPGQQDNVVFTDSSPSAASSSEQPADDFSGPAPAPPVTQDAQTELPSATTTDAWGAVLPPGSSSVADSGQIADPALTSPAAASVDPVSVVTPGLTDWLVPGQQDNVLFTDSSPSAASPNEQPASVGPSDPQVIPEPGGDDSPETPVPSDGPQVSTAAWGAVVPAGSSSVADPGQVADPGLASSAAASVDSVSVVTPGLTDWLASGQQDNVLFTDSSPSATSPNEQPASVGPSDPQVIPEPEQEPAQGQAQMVADFSGPAPAPAVTQDVQEESPATTSDAWGVLLPRDATAATAPEEAATPASDSSPSLVPGQPTASADTATVAADQASEPVPAMVAPAASVTESATTSIGDVTPGATNWLVPGGADSSLFGEGPNDSNGQETIGGDVPPAPDNDPAASVSTDADSTGSDQVETDVDPTTGMPYEYDPTTGNVQDVPIVGRDSAGNAIYQSSASAGGQEYEVSSSGGVLPGVIDTSSWDGPDVNDGYVNEWSLTPEQAAAGTGEATDGGGWSGSGSDSWGQSDGEGSYGDTGGDGTSTTGSDTGDGGGESGNTDGSYGDDQSGESSTGGEDYGGEDYGGQDTGGTYSDSGAEDYSAPVEAPAEAPVETAAEPPAESES